LSDVATIRQLQFTLFEEKLTFISLHFAQLLK